jgi:membrane-associated phospholipid phosphatase
MHVAVSSWIAIVFRNALAIGYALVIFFGSIMLGWHYGVDGLAGALGAAVCYFLATTAISKDGSRRAGYWSEPRNFLQM